MAKCACYPAVMVHKKTRLLVVAVPMTPAKLRLLAPGVSLRQLSKRTGIGMPHLSRIFSGKRGLTIRTARRIAQALALHSQRVIDTLVEQTAA